MGVEGLHHAFDARVDEVFVLDVVDVVLFDHVDHVGVCLQKLVGFLTLSALMVVNLKELVAAFEYYYGVFVAFCGAKKETSKPIGKNV